MERARRFKRPLSLLFFDINDFRSFNNKFSHATGNIILQTLVQHCRIILRSVDVFARFGGDEFVALLPETGLSHAETVARRLVDEIAAAKIPTPHGELSVTVSIGLSTLTGSTDGLVDLIDRANHAEHLAKQSQKSIVSMAE